MGIALVQMSDPGKMVGRNVEKSGGRTGLLVSRGPLPGRMRKLDSLRVCGTVQVQGNI